MARIAGRSFEAGLAARGSFGITVFLSNAFEARYELVGVVEADLRTVLPRTDPAAPLDWMGVVNKADMVGACHQGFHSLLITHHKHVGNLAE